MKINETGSGYQTLHKFVQSKSLGKRIKKAFTSKQNENDDDDNDDSKVW